MARDSGHWGGWPPPSRPRPADGIRARSRRGRIGDTWWSQRFVAVLESFNMGARLARGRTYARRGQVLELGVLAGVVESRVQGSRVRPYKVSIQVGQLSEAEWERVERAMGAKALFLAKLLAGEMPAQIEEVFADCSLSLFPARGADLVSACSCPDWGNPCKHVAATFLLLAEAFDQDPFLIFGWRGRSKDELLSRLRARRGAGVSEGAGAGEGETHDGWPVMADPGPLRQHLDRFWVPGPELDELNLPAPSAPAPDALLRQLDPSQVTVRGRPVVELMAPAYAVVSDAARRRLLGEAAEE